MLGNVPSLTNPLFNTTNAAVSVPSSGTKILYIPLEFWFNRNPGLALPLVALNMIGLKSIHPYTLERCIRENMLRSLILVKV